MKQAVSRSTAGYEEGADQYVTPDDRGDVAAARKLIADAGVDRTLSLRLAYSPDPVWFPLAAQAVQASLARAGIDVELVQLTSGDLYGRLLTNPETARRGEWDLAMVVLDSRLVWCEQRALGHPATVRRPSPGCEFDQLRPLSQWRG